MKHWKRLLSCVLAGSVALALAACGQQSAGGSSAGNQSKSQSTDQSREEVSLAAQSAAGSGADTSGTERGNVLVVYYSATGNTENAASYIAQATGGDLFEITPAEPYTDDDLNWSDENSRVTREHEDESLRDVELTTTQVENWDSYDTVFLGYPIWLAYHKLIQGLLH